MFSARQSRDLEPDQCKQKEKDIFVLGCTQSAGPFTGEAYQNPFFMPYETAVRQWTQCVPAEEGAGSSRRKVQQDGGVEIASARRKPRREI